VNLPAGHRLEFLTDGAGQHRCARQGVARG
jgi:hypothetical protein